MTANIAQRFLSLFRSNENSPQKETEVGVGEGGGGDKGQEEAAPDPEFFAQQLRKPSGEFSDKVAAKMDVVNGPLFDLTLKTLQLDDEESVLEIGFGSGEFFDKLFRQAEGLKISGIDYSEDMVDKAKQNNREAVESGDLTLELGNSNDLPFPDETFDKVFCNMVIYFWDRPDEHLKEVRRVLKPEGRFYTGIRSRESMHKFPFIEYGFNVFGREQWSSILDKNGFEVHGIETTTDPEMEIADQMTSLESICIVAGKKER